MDEELIRRFTEIYNSGGTIAGYSRKGVPLQAWKDGEVERTNSTSWSEEKSQEFTGIFISTSDGNITPVQPKSPKGQAREKTKERALRLKELKDHDPRLSQVNLAMKARRVLNDDSITQDTVKNAWTAMGWTWVKGDRSR